MGTSNSSLRLETALASGKVRDAEAYVATSKRNAAISAWRHQQALPRIEARRAAAEIAAATVHAEEARELKVFVGAIGEFLRLARLETAEVKRAKWETAWRVTFRGLTPAELGESYPHLNAELVCKHQRRVRARVDDPGLLEVLNWNAVTRRAHLDGVRAVLRDSVW